MPLKGLPPLYSATKLLSRPNHPRQCRPPALALLLYVTHTCLRHDLVIMQSSTCAGQQREGELVCAEASSISMLGKQMFLTL